jgi:DNA polymerase III epsilon subunit-like protein
MTDFIVIDTETGGLDATECALLSVAAVPSWEAPPFVGYLLPVGRVEPYAAKVNGYTPENWQKKGARAPELVLTDLVLWLLNIGEGRQFDMAAHNAGFDALFMLAAQERSGISLGLPGIWHCTKIKLQALRENGTLPPGRNRLDDLGELSGYWKAHPRSKAHDALEDARCCAHGLRWLREKKNGL